MSLFEQKVSLLSLKPVIREEEGRLHVQTNPLLQVLGLGSYCRHVTIDSVKRTLYVFTRWLWCLRKTEVVPFDRVLHLDYGFGGLMTGWSWWHGATDQVETFTVSVVLDDGEEVAIARFRGEGSKMTGVSGVVFGGDDLIDFSGDQEDASRAFCDRLSKILGVPLGAPVPHAADSTGRKYRCTACKRNSPPRRERCQYCGGAVGEIGLGP